MRCILKTPLYPVPTLFRFLIATAMVSAFLRCSPLALLSLLASYPLPFRLSLSLSTVFFLYLEFYYPANQKRYTSRLNILFASLLFLPVYTLFPFFTHVVLPQLFSLTPRIQTGVGILLPVSLILRPGFTFVHLVASGLILILMLSLHSLLLLLPATVIFLFIGLSVLPFLYYFPKMPNFFLSFAPIIRRTMATLVFLFLILTPQLVIFFRLIATHVLVVLLTPQTQRINYVELRLRKKVDLDYADAKWFISLLSWSFCALYVICNAAKIYIHTPF